MPAIQHHQNVERAFFASYLAACQGKDKNPAALCAVLYPDDSVSHLLLRSASSPATTTASSWAGALARTSVGAFFASLAPLSAASALIEAGGKVSLGGVREVLIPRRSGAPDTILWVGEGAPMPVTAISLDHATLGPPHKMATMVVLTAELARTSDGEAVVTQLLRESAALSLDAAYFSEDAATAFSPAGLLNGLSPAASASNTNKTEAILEDLATVAAAVSTNGSGQVVFIAHPATAVVASIMTETPVLPSPALPASRLIAVDPLSLVSGFGSAPEFRASSEATLHMEDTTPLQVATGAQGSATLATPTRSMFQTESIVIRVIVKVAFALRAPGAVAYTDVGW